MSLQKATFAAGCFWGVEATFRQLDGVIKTRVGYSGGTLENPSYEDVSTGRTGHAEALKITFDPEKISYDKLVDIFFKMHDPTTKNRQGPDVGTQYRSVIFYHTQEQKIIAETMKQKIQDSPKFKSRKIITEIVEIQSFFAAEDYHQQYFEKYGFHPCVNYLKLPPK